MNGAIGYIRVSSRSQNYATQREAIERAAEAKGDVITYWIEEKKSAKTLERPGLTQLRSFARRGEVRRLYVFRLDRLARSGVGDLLSTIDELRAHGTHIFTVADGFDLQGPAADVVVAVLGWAAQMERLALGERISAARTRIERAGGHWGRPREITPAKAQDIIERNQKGQSTRQIAVALKIPKSTVAEVTSGKRDYARLAPAASKKGSKKA